MFCIVNTYDIELEKFWQKNIPMCIVLPNKAGGYAIISELNEEGSNEIVQKSIRYINVGNVKASSYPAFKYDLPTTWPKN